MGHQKLPSGLLWPGAGILRRVADLMVTQPRDVRLISGMPPRRFPPPWSVEEHTGSFCIKDATGQAAPRMNIFMILTGYFDESGTHAGSELTLMAGFVGDARQWRKFEKRAGKLFGRFRVRYFPRHRRKAQRQGFCGLVG